MPSAKALLKELAEEELKHAQLKAEETVQELTAFRGKHPSVTGSELERAARDRALAMLSTKSLHFM